MLEGAAVGSHSIQSFLLYHDLKWRVGTDIHFSDIKSFVNQGDTKNYKVEYFINWLTAFIR